MKKYEKPELEIIHFDDADVITTSSTCGSGDNEAEQDILWAG